MNLKAIVPLALAVVFGLFAALLVKNAIARKTAAPTSSSNLVTVVVAKGPVDPGRELTAGDLSTSKIPADAAPEQVFSDPAALVGRVARTPLVKGQTVIDTLLEPAGAGSGLQALVPKGMRAITLEVTQFSSVGGMLQPGCHVDVISVLRDEKTNSSASRTILQNIKVQAVGRNLNPVPPADSNAPQAPAANDVTLLCTPKQSQQLELAVLSGRPWLVLRGNRDGDTVPADLTTLADLTSDRGEGRSSDTSLASNTGPAMPSNGTANGDPFATGPTTMPASPAARRAVSVLRGGTESTVMFTMPVAPETPATTPGGTPSATPALPTAATDAPGDTATAGGASLFAR